MKIVFLLFVTIFCVSCFDKSDDDSSVKQTESSNNNPDLKEVPSATVAESNDPKNAPSLSDYPRECPEAWGIVKGASKVQVEKFIQNYFHVPENSTAMYSEINSYTQADGSTLIKAGTYKMQDTIVDQEMVASFVAGAMTQCGARLRCASNPSVWVESCD